MVAQEFLSPSVGVEERGGDGDVRAALCSKRAPEAPPRRSTASASSPEQARGGGAYFCCQRRRKEKPRRASRRRLRASAGSSTSLWPAGQPAGDGKAHEVSAA